METRENGDVAVVFYMPIDKMISLPNGREYFFRVDRNVSLCFVPPADLDAILDVRGGCCGQRVSRIIRLASASDLRLWSHTADR